MSEFVKGYACAVATLIEAHGCTTEAEDVYRACFISAEGLKKMGVDERDIELLKPVIKEIERKRKLDS